MSNTTSDKAIRTTTSGSLPRTDALIAANAARTLADDGFTLQKTPEFDRLVAEAVADVVARQREAGITLLGDGEFGKAMSNAVDYGAWWSYSFQRVSGLELADGDLFNQPDAVSTPGNLRLTSFPNRRDRQLFPRVYSDPVDVGGVSTGSIATAFPSTTGRLAYTGHDAVATDIRNLKAALRPGEQGFLTAISPGSAARVGNQYYATDEEHIWAWADALREEYRAITDAGLVVQIDDRRWPRIGTRSRPSPASRTISSSPSSASTPSTTPSRVCRRSSSVSTCAGVPGTARTPPTSGSPTSSPSSSTPGSGRCLSRPAMSATSTNGWSGATWRCPTTSSSCRAW